MQNPLNQYQTPLPALDELAVLRSRALEPLFWRADRVDPLSAWCAHIPLAHWVVTQASHRVIVELGTHSGVSYAAFCAAVAQRRLDTRCYAVDTWAGDEHAGHYGDRIYDELYEYNERRFGSFSVLMRTTFDEASSHFPDQSIDLLHIDGLHTYEAVKHDFEQWLPKLSSQAIVLLHDSNEKQRDFGVWRFVAELKSRYPSFEFLHGHGLTLVAVGTDVPVAIRDLCALNSEDTVIVRDRFALLGARWETERRERALSAHYDAEVKKLAAERDALVQQGVEERLTESENRHSEELAQKSAEQEAHRLAEVEQINSQLQSVQAALGSANSLAEREAQLRSGLERDLQRARSRILSVEDARADLEAHMNEAIEQAQSKAAHAEAALRNIEMSTIWRATGPLRSALTRKPRARRNVGAALRARGAALAKQLPLGLSDRARLEDYVRVVTASPLFDADWYVERHPEAGTAGNNPVHYFVTAGTLERHDPGPGFDAEWYLTKNPDVAAHGVNALVHYEKFGRQEGRSIRTLDADDTLAVVEPVEPAFPTPAADWEPLVAAPHLYSLVAERFAPIAPMNVFRVAGLQRHVTLIIDSVNGTPNCSDPRAALAAASTLATRLGAGLRIVSRVEPIDAVNVDALFKAYGIEWNDNIDFVYSAPREGQAVAVGDDDVFTTTNWWIAASAIHVIDPRRVIHLVQDDERSLYPNGEERLRCAETLATPGLRLIVDSRTLFRQLAAERAISTDTPWFDPPLSVRGVASGATDAARSGDKRQFVFHARPDLPRHLYWRGLEVIGACLEDGILDPQVWDINFVGARLTPVVLPGDVRARLHTPASLSRACADYRRLLESADVALCLMDSAHPGYVALDFAAFGAEVVTNRHGTKSSLEHYSPNLTCADMDVSSLKLAIRKATQRERATVASAAASWQDALAPTLGSLEFADAGAH